MSSAVQDTIKALVEFEAELDGAKSAATEASRRLLKDAEEWATSAKSSSLSNAQEKASGRLAKARAEAEKDADRIRAKGAEDLKAFEGSISRRKSKAADHVVSRLMGSSK
ncbi:MAG: hypothetical protein HY247_04910 [archaeon]|nr:MAG: hypothetical protein HY247_04910 [archaeon]